jgi:Uma2 family endonuclease
MATTAKRKYTPDEYLQIERAAEFRSEYFSGEIVALPPSSERHVLIASNIRLAVALQTKSLGCRTYASDLRIHVKSTYIYPDVSVVCGEVKQADDNYLDNLLNPTVIFEVLSKSTEAYDRGEKFARYQGIDSLKTYILVAQDKPRVEVFTRLPDNSWRMRVFTEFADVVEIEGIDCRLTVSDVYDQVEFGGTDESSRPILV